MANRRTVDNRDPERRENSCADSADRWAARNGRVAIWKIAEEQSANLGEFSGVFQMHEDAVDLVGFHGAVFEDENCSVRIDFPWSAERGFQQRHCAAEHDSLGRTRTQDITLQRNGPGAQSSCHRIAKGGFILAAGSTGTVIEACGQHRAVKPAPAMFLPKIDL